MWLIIFFFTSIAHFVYWDEKDGVHLFLPLFVSLFFFFKEVVNRNCIVQRKWLIYYRFAGEWEGLLCVLFFKTGFFLLLLYILTRVSSNKCGLDWFSVIEISETQCAAVTCVNLWSGIVYRYLFWKILSTES